MTSIPKHKGIPVEFSDGQVLVVPPLTLGALESVQERLQNFKGGLDRESISLCLDVATLSLQRNYPEITREKLAEDMVDLGNMEEVMWAVMDVSGMRRKELAQGEAVARNP